MSLPSDVRFRALENARGYHTSLDVSCAALSGVTVKPRSRAEVSGDHAGRATLLNEDIAMNRFDFTPYRRTTVGFDRLFDLLERQARLNAGDNYPPFNIERQGEDAYRITLAVAGFKPGELDITAQQNLLTIKGDKAEAEGKDFVHVGIANRGFERRFELADFVRVERADLADGLLVIDLVREVPEAMKPKKIVVGGNAALSVVEDEKAEDQAA
jgi:molecular chaperone IbpA